MMNHEENELLCRVEGAAPMGQLMRRYWLPACLSEEIADPDGAPVPCRLLGEDLVAWRNSDGKPSVMDRYCPHRKASLEFARNEENGLRCLYHGWKIDIAGVVVEMPSEPPLAREEARPRMKAYPVEEAGGIIWVYMGPPELKPVFEPPLHAPNPQGRVAIVKIQVNCNWAQCLEGNIDSAHSSSLHSSNFKPSVGERTEVRGMTAVRPSTDKAPRLQVERHPFGFRYAAIRRPSKNADQFDYVRTTTFVAPFTVLVPPNALYNNAAMMVPIDDTHTMFHFIAWSEDPEGGIDQEAYRKRQYAQVGIHVDKRWISRATPENGYLQDRTAMKVGDFSGFKGVPNQDIPMWESMGPIVNRSLERLGASDVAIVEFRNLMVESARRFSASDCVPRGDGTLQFPLPPRGDLRAAELMLPKGTDWRTIPMHLKPAANQA